MKHVKYAQIVEKKDDYPVEDSHLGFKMPDTSPITIEEVQRHIERTLSEIIIVVEAIDPQLSGTFQAVQSYKYDNIELNCRFERCLFVRYQKFYVDMERFHVIENDDKEH
jgi:fatty acid-binding protein DegV